MYHETTNTSTPVTVEDSLVDANYFGSSPAFKATKATAILTSETPQSEWRCRKLVSNSDCSGPLFSNPMFLLALVLFFFFRFDFCNSLLFPSNIQSIQLSVAAETGFPVAVARPPRGNCTVLVETQPAMVGTITLSVDTTLPRMHTAQ